MPTPARPLDPAEALVRVEVLAADPQVAVYLSPQDQTALRQVLDLARAQSQLERADLNQAIREGDMAEEIMRLRGEEGGASQCEHEYPMPNCGYCGKED